MSKEFEEWWAGQTECRRYDTDKYELVRRWAEQAWMAAMQAAQKEYEKPRSGREDGYDAVAF